VETHGILTITERVSRIQQKPMLIQDKNLDKEKAELKNITENDIKIWSLVKNTGKREGQRPGTDVHM